VKRREIADDNNYERELFPYEFSPGSKYKFPFRTALTFNQNISFIEPVDVFSHTNNFFLFEEDPESDISSACRQSLNGATIRC